jgi:hypothetical protein
VCKTKNVTQSGGCKHLKRTNAPERIKRLDGASIHCPKLSIDFLLSLAKIKCTLLSTHNAKPAMDTKNDKVKQPASKRSYLITVPYRKVSSIYRVTPLAYKHLTTSALLLSQRTAKNLHQELVLFRASFVYGIHGGHDAHRGKKRMRQRQHVPILTVSPQKLVHVHVLRNSQLYR